LASTSRNWPRPRPRSSGLVLGLGLEVLASFNIIASVPSCSEIPAHRQAHKQQGNSHLLTETIIYNECTDVRVFANSLHYVFPKHRKFGDLDVGSHVLAGVVFSQRRDAACVEDILSDERTRQSANYTPLVIIGLWWLWNARRSSRRYPRHQRRHSSPECSWIDRRHGHRSRRIIGRRLRGDFVD